MSDPSNDTEMQPAGVDESGRYSTASHLLPPSYNDIFGARSRCVHCGKNPTIEALPSTENRSLGQRYCDAAKGLFKVRRWSDFVRGLLFVGVPMLTIAIPYVVVQCNDYRNKYDNGEYQPGCFGGMTKSVCGLPESTGYWNATSPWGNGTTTADMSMMNVTGN